MRTTSPARTRKEASMAAARELERLGIDKSRPIDIFEIIREEGIWLMFQPLKNLYGAYLREKDIPGIIVHAKHPRSLQRFTAAHEFGHHVLKHGTRLDDADYIERAGNNSNLEEVAADAFAAFFLMPLQLVNTMLRRMGLPLEPGELTDIQVYRLALDMGVSYRAAVNHLVALRKIRPEVGNELKRQTPKTIKAKLGRGSLLENSWADVWVLDQTNSGESRSVRIEDELHISLPENPSTGYIWTLELPVTLDMTDENRKQGLIEFDTAQRRLVSEAVAATAKEQQETAPLALVRDEFESFATGETRLGKGGTRYLDLRALRAGQVMLMLHKRRPWQNGDPSAATFELALTILPKPTGDTERGLSEPQKPLAALSHEPGSGNKGG
jgi:Zn-dependent peptidase ImmA (M78 family)/predicted secreted protein